LEFTDRSELFQEVDKAHRALHALYFSLWESGPYSTRKRDEELPPASDRTFWEQDRSDYDSLPAHRPPHGHAGERVDQDRGDNQSVAFHSNRLYDS
jgi:hypothetical protein